MPLACYAIRVLHQAPWHLLGRVLRGTAHSTALAHLQLLAQLRDAVPVDVLDLCAAGAVRRELNGAARCALRRVVLCGACVPRHTRSAGVLTHARSAAACVAPGCVVGCANTDSAARAPMRWTAHPERRCRLRLVYPLQPVDCRAVRLALPCELPLRRAEDLAEPEPHFVHHLRGGGAQMPFSASAGGRKLPNGCGPTVAVLVGSFRCCARKRVRSSRRHGFTVGACGPYASPVTSATAVPRTPSARTSSAIETLKLRASTAMCVVSCSAAGWPHRCQL